MTTWRQAAEVLLMASGGLAVIILAVVLNWYFNPRKLSGTIWSRNGSWSRQSWLLLRRKDRNIVISRDCNGGEKEWLYNEWLYNVGLNGLEQIGVWSTANDGSLLLTYHKTADDRTRADQ